ncbi:MAG: hypothetical protein LBT78_07780 [Tannerella sp.]|jgi:hypothetical protein|nr:hypothetical protein [Tannerella sp.]
MIQTRIARKYESSDRQPCIICDIDGTLAYNTHRDIYNYDNVIRDAHNLHLKNLLDLILKGNDNIQLLFVSGREEKCREQTEEWLRNLFPEVNFCLYMRLSRDTRQDAIVKEEIFIRYIINKYNILAVFDDRDQCVNLWRDKFNLFTLQVDYGNF